MANACKYEIRARGAKNHVMRLGQMMPCSYDMDPKMLNAEGTKDDFRICFTGDTKWSLDAYCHGKRNVVLPFDLEDGYWDDLPDEDLDDFFCSAWEELATLPMRQKSELLQIGIYALLADESFGYISIYHWNCGELIYSVELIEGWRWRQYDCTPYEDYISAYKDSCRAFFIHPSHYPPTWNKDKYNTYEQFCREFEINPGRIPESEWQRDAKRGQNVFIYESPSIYIPLRFMRNKYISSYEFPNK